MLSERSLSQKVPPCLFLSEQSRRGKSLGRKRMGCCQGLRREGLRLSIRLPDGYGVSFGADDNVPKLDRGGGRGCVMSGRQGMPPEWLISGYVNLSVNQTPAEFVSSGPHTHCSSTSRAGTKCASLLGTDSRSPQLKHL